MMDDRCEYETISSTCQGGRLAEERDRLTAEIEKWKELTNDAGEETERLQARIAELEARVRELEGSWGLKEIDRHHAAKRAEAAEAQVERLLQTLNGAENLILWLESKGQKEPEPQPIKKSIRVALEGER